MPDVEPDWKLRYRSPLLAMAAVADGAPDRGVVLSNRTGVVQAHAWHLPDGEVRQLTALDAGLRFAVIDPLGEAVYYLHDDGGNEVGHLTRVPWEGGDAVDLTPSDDPYAVAGVGVSRDGRWFGATTATRAGFEVFVAAVDHSASGLVDRRPLFRSSALSSGPWLSADGSVAVVATTHHSGSLDTDLIVVDVATAQETAQWIDGDAKLTAIGFADAVGDPRLLVSSNVSGFARPVVWDTVTDRRLEPDPTSVGGFHGELIPLDWHPAGEAVLLRHVLGAITRLVVWDLGTSQLRPVPHERCNVVNAWYGADGALCAEVNDSTRPTHVVEIDPTSGAVDHELLALGDPPPGRRWRSVTFPSTDDAVIQAWVAHPDGVGPFPTIVDTHGGPTAARLDEWSPEAQAWLDQGFAYMSVNYRGSTTFGHDFEASIRGDLGRREVDDMVAGRRWLVEQGIADPSLVFLTGWSYGGYLTLLALGRRPELWAGGIAGIAIGDWRLMYEDMNETLRQYGVSLFGGTPEQIPAVYERSSPITYADQVTAPVLVIQGSNDTRCPARQLRAYEERMRELGRTIEVVWFEAGHGGVAPEQRIDFQSKMFEFVAEVRSRAVT